MQKTSPTDAALYVTLILFDSGRIRSLLTVGATARYSMLSAADKRLHILGYGYVDHGVIVDDEEYVLIVKI